MCGVVGIIGEKYAAEKMYTALFSLQHRGQDAAGILTYDFENQNFHLEKSLGLVADVFSRESITKLSGSMAIGHTRYSTIGSVDKQDLQPMVLSYPYGIGLVHNGNVTNYQQVQENLRDQKNRFTFTKNDLEVLLHSLAEEMVQTKEQHDSVALLQSAVKQVLEQVQGAYSCVGLLANRGLFAFSDSFGIRPLLLGRKLVNDKFAYCVASETQVFVSLGYQYVRDVEAGEFIFIDREMNFHSRRLVENTSRPCMFEWIYFAGAESQWHGSHVYQARVNLGKILAEECKGIDIDLVAPVPDTSRPAAAALAEMLQKPLREVLIKNRYIQRSFIASRDKDRSQLVALKLSPIVSEIAGKNILLVDDSIVRGTTSRRMVELLKAHGANKVYFASTCPPIRFPCFYGIDFPTTEELMASRMSKDEMAQELGVEKIFFLPIEKLKEALGVGSTCMACLNGDYPVSVNQEKFMQSRRVNEVDKKSVNKFTAEKII